MVLVYLDWARDQRHAAGLLGLFARAQIGDVSDLREQLRMRGVFFCARARGGKSDVLRFSPLSLSPVGAVQAGLCNFSRD